MCFSREIHDELISKSVMNYKVFCSCSNILVLRIQWSHPSTEAQTRCSKFKKQINISCQSWTLPFQNIFKMMLNDDKSSSKMMKNALYFMLS